MLILLQAVYLGLFGALWAVASRFGSAIVRIVASPIIWVAVEYLRSILPLRGFTWGQLAQSQHNLEWMLRPARIGGGWLVAFIVVCVAACLVELTAQVSARRWGRGAAVCGVAVLLLVLPLALPRAAADGAPIRTAIVQGNVPRDGTGSSVTKDIVIINSHRRQTEALAGEDIDLIVWPESSVGIDLERNPGIGEKIVESAQTVGAPMIVGANLDIDADRYRVVALQFDAEGEIVDRYQKTHLVPFGEYVPGRDLIGWLPILDQVPRDAVPDDEPTVFDVAGGKVAPVISFEGDFGSLVRGRIDEGGRLLVVATNTSTWGESWASAQHVAFSQVRSAENGVWTIHAALSGISAFVAPDGTVVASTPLWTATSLLREVRFAEDASFYARTGDWLPWTCLIASVVLVLVGWKRGEEPELGNTRAKPPIELS